MHIVSNEDASALVHDDVQYDADENGLFDVPWDLGQQLVGFPGWREATEEEQLRAAGSSQPEPEPEPEPEPDGDPGEPTDEQDPDEGTEDDDEAEETPPEADGTPSETPKRKRRRPRPATEA